MKKRSDRQQTSDDWTEFVNSKKKRKVGKVPKDLDRLAKDVQAAYKPLGNERQLRFVQYLAEYLVADQVHKSILLQMRSPAALEWQKLRNATPVFGYPTVEEAEKELIEFLKGL
jgi:hypothetical protein